MFFVFGTAGAGRFTAAKVADGQVIIEYLAHAVEQFRIDLFEPFCHVLMHGRLAYVEVRGGGTDGAGVFDYVFA